MVPSISELQAEGVPYETPSVSQFSNLHRSVTWEQSLVALQTRRLPRRQTPVGVKASSESVKAAIPAFGALGMTHDARKAVWVSVAVNVQSA